METIILSKFNELLQKEDIDNSTLAQTVVNEYLEKGITLATAESCTGGLISKKITDISGSSQMFEFGVCTYANIAKEKLINVSHKTLSEYGAVSYQTAMQMANGVRTVANSTVAVSTTGIAGPNGGTKEKPVGLVYVAVSTKEETKSYKIMPEDNLFLTREEIRNFASQVALYLALDVAKKLYRK